MDMDAHGWKHGEPDTMTEVADRVETNEGRVEYITHMLNVLALVPDTPLRIILTAWELDFVASVTDQFERRGSLTDKQMEHLERIYAEKAE